MLSGPSVKKNVALTPCFENVSSSRGTPSRVPRKVSTSTRKPSALTLTGLF